MLKYVKNNPGFILVLFLGATPIIMWFLIMPVSQRFYSPSAVFRSLGQVAGLLGMALISINFILSARFKFLDSWFNGLNRVYIKHHEIGAISFCLILFHPAFLAVQYLFVSLQSSFDFLFSFNDTPIVLGEISLLAFIILLVITFYSDFKYQNWKNTHKFLGIVLFLGGLHMVFVPSDISGNPVLRYYMISIAALGGLSYVYRTVLEIYKRNEYKYVLEEVVKIDKNVVELKLAPLGKRISFLPGQFIFIRFDSAAGEMIDKKIVSESHPFSITSFPENEILSLGVKRLGDFSSLVHELKPGATCIIEGPFGVFSYEKAKSKKQIWVAGGIGITPFLGMARQLNAKGGDGYEIYLFYSAKNESGAAFSEELMNISKNISGLKLFLHISDEQGRISAKYIADKTGDISNTEVFLCGPAGFMRNLKSQFTALGLDNRRIYSEEFSL